MISSHLNSLTARERQREMIAQADRHRLARQLRELTAAALPGAAMMTTRQRPPGPYRTGSIRPIIAAMRVRLDSGGFFPKTHLSVVTLRHYHEVGLLIPVEMDPQV